MPTIPSLLLHADWSTSPRKRWYTAAHLQPDGSYLASAPQLVPALERFLMDIRQQIGPQGCALLGFDFPIGIPHAYAHSAGVNHFPTFLAGLGREPWPNFYEIAAAPEQISIHRPFYPLHPGGTSHSQLLSALGMNTMDDLRRRCELAHPGRRAASPLFWTLGAQQVGKACITGWRDLLAPALGMPSSRVHLWPFEGRLGDLLQPGNIVAAETYPAEFYAPLGIRFSRRTSSQRSGKRSQADRSANAGALSAVCRECGLQMQPDLAKTIANGFGQRPQAEDAFDSTIGLLGMLRVLRGDLPQNPQLPAGLLSIEGWILGQAA